jgi:hypothetical protein
LGVSNGDIGSPVRHRYACRSRQEKTMAMTAMKYMAPWLAAAAIGSAIALAPMASADTDPAVPYGTEPHSPYVLGYHVSNHDEATTTNGQVDVPF